MNKGLLDLINKNIDKFYLLIDSLNINVEGGIILSEKHKNIFYITQYYDKKSLTDGFKFIVLEENDEVSFKFVFREFNYDDIELLINDMENSS